jgi:hypothetical protein
MSSDSLASLIDEDLPYLVFRLVFVIVLLLVTPILKCRELLITENSGHGKVRQQDSYGEQKSCGGGLFIALSHRSHK